MFVSLFVCKSEEVEFIKGNLNIKVLVCVLKFLTGGRPPNSSAVLYCGCSFEEPVLNSKGLFQEAVLLWPWVLIFVTGMELWDLVHKCLMFESRAYVSRGLLYTAKLHTVQMHDVLYIVSMY
jgi:hypothetical protein